MKVFVLKVHQRCDLACDYCYVYTQADQSWRGKPAAMSAEVRHAAIAAIGRHVRTHHLRKIRVVLHGGEPLLYGNSRIAQTAIELRGELPATCDVELGIQTNGMRLDSAALDIFRAHSVRVGISVDGTAADHDKHRRTRSGRGSFATVTRALNLLARPENKDIYAGILCTVDPITDPVACFEQLADFDPPMIDVLLPHANWDTPPWRPPGIRSPTPYGDWLVKMFDRWYRGSEKIRVRLFDDLIGLVLAAGVVGGESGSEQVGVQPSAVVVVESDGSIEQVDALKSAYDGGCATGLSVLHDEFDAVLEDPGILARQLGVAALSDQCQSCSIHNICGSGHYAHRYRRGLGFRNPSVYCDDLRTLIEHVRHCLEADVRGVLAAWSRTVTLQLDAHLFDDLSRGGGGKDAVETLRRGQTSKHLQLIAFLLDSWPDEIPGKGEIIATLERAQMRSPTAFLEVMGAPLTGAYTAIAARAVSRGMASPDDLRYLGAVAVAACVKAQVAGEWRIPVRDSVATLPGLGAAPAAGAGEVSIATEGGRVWTRDGSSRTLVTSPPYDNNDDDWLPIRSLRAEAAGQAIRLGLDDLDPYRHGHHAPPAQRLDPDEYSIWQSRFEEAWHLLATYLPARAAEIASGLRTLIPLRQLDQHAARSATLRHAFGAFGLTLPPTAVDFAITVIHEFQHSKLSALLDVEQLFDPTDDGRYFAPWRSDPRPIGGLLQGVYAFVGVADAWRSLRAEDSLSSQAERQFAVVRLQVDCGLRAIEQSSALTDAGERLASRLRETVDAMLAESIASGAVQRAEQHLSELRQRWEEAASPSASDRHR